MITRLRLVAMSLALLAVMNAPAASPTNDPVARIDPARFAGKWYSLYSIPTFLDKNWRETTENYTPRTDGTGYDVFTTYRKAGETRVRDIRSTLFSKKGRPDGELGAQFFWPVKVPYLIIELPSDYSYMVGGSPNKKMLFILSPHPTLPEATLEGIVARCKARGYDTEKLTSQEHRP